MEALDRIISIAMSGGLLSSLFVGTRFDISHILFTDDAFIFTGTNPYHLCHLQCLYLCFEVISGLKVNLAKLELVLVVNVANIDGLAGNMGCRVSPFLLT
jgi:hypothetical protein